VAVLDASALIALLNGEPGASAVEAVLRDPDRASAVSAVNVAETVDVLIRIYGIAASDVAEAFDLLELGGLAVVEVSPRTAWRAGLFRAARYRRRGADVSLADGIAAVTAEGRGEPLVTSDRALAVVARAAGIDVVPIPDAAGART
jgi:predicted nucleic acid-binding protein